MLLFRCRKAKRELQEEQWADQRKDKEEAAAKYRKRMEEKAKEREEKSKQTEDGKSDQPKKQERLVMIDDETQNLVKTVWGWPIGEMKENL